MSTIHLISVRLNMLADRTSVSDGPMGPLYHGKHLPFFNSLCPSKCEFTIQFKPGRMIHQFQPTTPRNRHSPTNAQPQRKHHDVSKPGPSNGQGSESPSPASRVYALSPKIEGEDADVSTMQGMIPSYIELAQLIEIARLCRFVHCKSGIMMCLAQP
jgi:hypothetical protein